MRLCVSHSFFAESIKSILISRETSLPRCITQVSRIMPYHRQYRHEYPTQKTSNITNSLIHRHDICSDYVVAQGLSNCRSQKGDCRCRHQSTCRTDDAECREMMQSSVESSPGVPMFVASMRRLTEEILVSYLSVYCLLSVGNVSQC
jgi:hypothetical protein